MATQRTVLHWAAAILTALALAACAQTQQQVLVGVGAEAFATEPARGYAELYLPYAQMSALAYDDRVDTRGCPLPDPADKPPSDSRGWLGALRRAGWRCIASDKAFALCPPGHQCVEGLSFHIWRRGCDFALAFRGTDRGDLGDRLSDLHWFIHGPELDEYGKLGFAMPQIMARIAAAGCARPRIVATGHSLGGGLAQFAAYADRRVRYVYAFNSSPVTAYLSAPGDIVRTVEGLGIDRVYEAGEILAPVRFLISGFFAPRPCRPYVRTIRFDIGEPGGLLDHHSIDRLANGLDRLTHRGPPAPLPTGFKAAGSCNLADVPPR
jgi:hypothetical protein